MEHNFKVGDKVRENRQGAEPFTIGQIDGNMVYPENKGPNTPGSGYHVTKIVPHKQQAMKEERTNHNFKVGDEVRENRQGAKPFTIDKVVGNTVYPGNVHVSKLVHHKQAMKEDHLQLVRRVITEAEDKSYTKFYHNFAQHLEKQGYDYEESDLQGMPFEPYKKHVESNYQIPDEMKKHSFYQRALRQHHRGFDPNKAMN